MNTRCRPTFLALSLLAAGACAQDSLPTPPPEESPDPVLQPRLSADVEHDTNVLRGPDAVSDRALVLGAGLKVDQRWSLQRFTLDAQALGWRYRDLSNLDYHTLAYDAAWTARVTPWLEGLLSARRRQYRDTTDPTPGTGSVFRRTERDELAQATWLAPGGWRALAGVSRRSSRSEDPRALESSPRVDSVRLGGGYELAAGARVLAWLRRGDGHYDSGIAPDFRETEPTVSLHWPATGSTTLDLQVGHLRRKHDAEPARDFRGTVGTLTGRWRYSPKTRVEVGMARDLGSYEFAGGGHVRGWRAFLEPVWQATAKLTLRLRLSRETRAWHVVTPGSPDAGRDDRNHQALLAVDWEPARPVRVTASVRRERRDSSLDVHDFRATVVDLGARLTF